MLDIAAGRYLTLCVTDTGTGMTPDQISKAAREGRPGLKTLLISGYAESAAIGGSGLGPGMQVLAKPFAVEALTSRVCEMIDT